jgi:hypothetical protein
VPPEQQGEVGIEQPCHVVGEELLRQLLDDEPAHAGVGEQRGDRNDP